MLRRRYSDMCSADQMTATPFDNDGASQGSLVRLRSRGVLAEQLCGSGRLQLLDLGGSVLAVQSSPALAVWRGCLSLSGARDATLLRRLSGDRPGSRQRSKLGSAQQPSLLISIVEQPIEAVKKAAEVLARRQKLLEEMWRTRWAGDQCPKFGH